ncbi:MAG TPA: hypothetical protein VGC79_12890 [Polyangiaceae bacterium]
MSSGVKVPRRRAGASSLSAEDRAFLDFVARLAVEEAMREANSGPTAVTCGGEQAEGESGNDDNS